MHCVSCEILLEQKLQKYKGIKLIKISHKKGVLEVAFEDLKQEKNLLQLVKNCGYKVLEGKHDQSKKMQNNFTDYLQIIAIALMLLLVFKIFNKLEISKFFPDINQNISVLVALFLGFIASVSTCLALVGGIVIGFGSNYSEKENKKHLLASRAIPHLYFHLGRVGGFILLGGLLGLIGSKINYSLAFTGYFTILIGMVMLYLGLQSLKIVPNITKLGFHLPKIFSKKIHSLKDNNHHFTPILIGILTFFVPCGFTQSMQLAAIASQSLLNGALIMGAFAIGTLPVLIALGIGSTYAQKSRFGFTKKFLGVVVVFFAIYSLNSGLILAGSSFTLVPNFKKSVEIKEADLDKNVQVIQMKVDWIFQPNEFRIKKDVPVRWEIKGVNVSACSNEVVIPRLNLSKKIRQGETSLLEFTPKEAGILPFSCWMGMISGRFIVEE